MEDERWVETEAVEGKIQSEPTPRATYQGREVGPLGEVGDKIPPRSLGYFDSPRHAVLDDIELAFGNGLVSFTPSIRLEGHLWERTEFDEVSIARGLIQIPLDVHRKSWRFWDGHSRPNGEQAWNHSDPDDDSPYVID